MDWLCVILAVTTVVGPSVAYCIGISHGFYDSDKHYKEELKRRNCGKYVFNERTGGSEFTWESDYESYERMRKKESGM